MPSTRRPRPPATWSRRSTRTTSSRSRTTSRPSRRTSPPSSWTLFPPEHTETDKGHGRIETRAIWTSTALTGYLTFPYGAQVFCLHRHTTDLAGQLRRAEVVYGITSLSPAQADPRRLLALTRGHWTIENKVHWVRDVTFDEDRSQVRRHAGPHVMASLRNLALSLLRLAGATNIARGLRRCAWQPGVVLRLIGIALA